MFTREEEDAIREIYWQASPYDVARKVAEIASHKQPLIFRDQRRARDAAAKIGVFVSLHWNPNQRAADIFFRRFPSWFYLNC